MIWMIWLPCRHLGPVPCRSSLMIHRWLCPACHLRVCSMQAAVLAYNQAWNLFDPVLNADPLHGVTGASPLDVPAPHNVPAGGCRVGCCCCAVPCGSRCEALLAGWRCSVLLLLRCLTGRASLPLLSAFCLCHKLTRALCLITCRQPLFVGLCAAGLSCV